MSFRKQCQLAKHQTQLYYFLDYQQFMSLKQFPELVEPALVSLPLLRSSLQLDLKLEQQLILFPASFIGGEFLVQSEFHPPSLTLQTAA